MIVDELLKQIEERGFCVCMDFPANQNTIVVKSNKYSAIQLHIAYNNDKTVFTCRLIIKTERYMFDGDRSDITALIAIWFTIIYGEIFDDRCIIQFSSHPIEELEFYSCVIYLLDGKYVNRESKNAPIDDIMELLIQVSICELVLSSIFNLGPESNLIADIDENFICKISDNYKIENEFTDMNYNSRKNDKYSFAYIKDKNTIIFHFDKKLDLPTFIKSQQEPCKGVKKSIIVKKIGKFAVGNSILNSSNKIITQFENCTKRYYYSVENAFFALGERTLVCVWTNCNKNVLEQEQNLIKERQQQENAVIFAEQKFIWSDNIDGEKFELMIGELLNYQKEYRLIRKIGSAREGDGGRDYQAEKALSRNGRLQFIRIIVQCKAYKKTVGKSDVRDIRDTLDNFNAKGYLLVVSSRISVSLQNYLENIRDNHDFFIDWWNREDIEFLLRKFPEIVARYSEVVTTESR